MEEAKSSLGVAEGSFASLGMQCKQRSQQCPEDFELLLFFPLPGLGSSCNSQAIVEILLFLIKGDTGEKGDKGPVGQGIDGPDGDQGLQGKSVQITSVMVQEGQLCIVSAVHYNHFVPVTVIVGLFSWG